MATDFTIQRRDGRPSDFRLSEWPSWWLMSAADVAGVIEAVQTHLQPVRDRWGPLLVTSGPLWSWGERRTGAHAIPGTTDYVPLAANLDDVFGWAALNLGQSFGTLINERNHLHRTPWGAQGRYGLVLLEPTEGVYEAVDVGARARPLVLAGAALLVALAARRPKK